MMQATTEYPARNTGGMLSSSLRRSVRLIALGAHIVAGLGIATWLFPRYSNEQRNHAINRWSRRLLHIIGLRLRVHGRAANVTEPVLLLSNHVSWLDIYALNANNPARFVAKSDIRTWPVIGRFCTSTGTLFVNRNNKHDVRRVNTEIARALQEGNDVALFPEGTTTDGTMIQPFRSALLQAAVDNHTLVQPVYLRYLDARGNITTLPAYYGDISLGGSLWRLLGTHGLCAEIHYLPPLRANEEGNRRTLARATETRIRDQHERLCCTSIPSPTREE